MRHDPAQGSTPDPRSAQPEPHRRQVLVAGTLGLVACTGPRRVGREPEARLDRLLEAHAGRLPERAGAGANHYPMAAEVLDAWGRGETIDESWIDGAELYAGEPGRGGPLRTEAQLAEALGTYERFGDWLDTFREALARESWRPVVAEWAVRLAPALSAAAYHGVIRTGHAVRALRRRDTPARREELAAGLAYWAARYVELPARAGETGHRTPLSDLASPWVHDRTDVAFDEVLDRLVERPLAPRVSAADTGTRPAEDLHAVVRDAAAGFLEMLVLERHRIWLLHTVTGPAAVQWLLPEVDERGARHLVAHARQSVAAMFAAYGEPFTPRAHVRPTPSGWTTQRKRAVEQRSVHGIKLVDALARFDRDGDPLWRSVAEQWFEWT